MNANNYLETNDVTKIGIVCKAELLSTQKQEP